MYKFERYCQLGMADFNQSARLKMNLENCWVKKSAIIPRDAIEEKYVDFSQQNRNACKAPPHGVGIAYDPEAVRLFQPLEKTIREEFLDSMNEIIPWYH